MRTLALALLFAVVAAPAAAQEAPDAPTPDEPAPTGGALRAEGYVALSADERAQLSLGGFRRYLERTREADPRLYATLDARLDDLEYRETTADVIFWTGTGLGVAAAVTAIPIHLEVNEDVAVGLIIGGVSTFLLAVIIQAIVRPGHGDLMQLVDLYDERLGRR